MWDERKADDNLAKHGITFNEAASVFYDSLSIAYQCTPHDSTGEEAL